MSDERGMTTTNPAPPYLPEDDLLWRQLKTIPAFRAILRAVESRFYFAVDLPGPVLDLGCGDGHFAQMTFDRRIDVGLDPWWNPLKKSTRSGAYNFVLQGMGDRMPFPDASFASAFSNSVLEHIPDIQPVLNETGRVLQENGRFLITMPSQYFTEELGGAQFLEKMGMDGMAGRYRRLFNRITRHAHTDTPEMWAARLAKAGFAVERWQYYFSTEALHALEIGHAQGMPSAIIHALTRTWIVAPWESSLKLTERWLRPFYEEEAAADKGAYLLIVARKQGNGPIPPNLPPARPFTLAELEAAVTERRPAAPPEIAPEETAVPPPPLPVPAESEPEPAPEPLAPESPAARFDLIAAGLLGLSVMLALVGQLTISSAGGSGLRWFLLSFGTLLLLAWRSGTLPVRFSGKRPFARPHTIPKRRWLYLPALLLVLLAFRQASLPGSSWPPWLTIGLWIEGILVGYYSLHENSRRETPPHKEPPMSRHFLFLAGALLFLTALIIRFAGLGSHPWIINGLESSLGLDAWNMANGLFANPFASGWMANPALPLFLMAIPLKLMGPGVTALRFLSPIVGALTVLATFYFGYKLWRVEVGLLAAVLLTGSHFHIHYSRLGLTNSWDALLVLLALGALAVAWQEGKAGCGRRQTWLLAGTAVGLNAYTFTASRLLPLLLVVLLVTAVLFGRETFRTQFWHILAAFALALLVALPQLLYYHANPGLFMERFHALSLLGTPTDWAAQARMALSAFNANSDVSAAYSPGRPLLSNGLALLFVLGVMVALLRIRRFQNGLLLLWLVVTLIGGGMLLIESPASHRLLAALPAVCLLAAAALAALGEWAAALWSPGGEAEESRAAQWMLPALLIIVAVIALSEMAFYFGAYRQGHTFADRNTEIAQGVAEYLNTLDGETTTAYFYGPPNMYINFPTIPFLAQGFTANDNLYDVASEEETAVLPGTDADNLVFIFLPERAGEMEDVRRIFPNGEDEAASGYHANPLFYTYEVER